jgi:protein-L-isoaspartate O-methyltransferase
MRAIATVIAALAYSSSGCTPAPSAAAPERVNAPSTLRAPDVSYEPSLPRVVAAMLRLADVKSDDLVYDLGSGDGRIPISAARNYGARAVGIEIDPKLVERARKNAQAAGVADRVTFRNQDLFEADFSDATVVTLFLSPEVNLKLRPKLLAVLRPGTRIVNHWHDMGNWKPARTIRIDGVPIYLWRIPARAALIVRPMSGMRA